MSARIIDLETEKARRMRPVRFHTVAQVERRVFVDIQGEFTTAAARVLANAILQRCDAVDFDNSQDPEADR